MPHADAINGLEGPAAIPLRSITAGRRTISSFSGSPLGLWAGSRAGRLALLWAQKRGASSTVMLPGPVWSICGPGVPMLSWFSLSATCADPMTQALRAVLAEVDELGADEGLRPLMDRMVSLRADAVRTTVPSCPPELEAPRNHPRILLLDQERDGHFEAAFDRMVAAARAEHPNAEIWIWPARNGQGCLFRNRGIPAEARRIARGFSFFSALPHLDAVYTVSAPEGMQALIAGKPLRVFGRPYYAGWGLTGDDQLMADRTFRPTVAELFDAVYVRLARYLEPEGHGFGTLTQVLDGIAIQRAVQARYADCRQIAGIRFQLWKRPFATPFLTAGGGVLRWPRSIGEIQPGERVALWGGKSQDGIAPGTPMLRIEDGFFHSDGLGSDMHAPRSQVLDRHGLYFDARGPSELTHILNSARFDIAELERASALRELVCRLGVTKYNLGRRAPRWQSPLGRRVLLVAGQVADDASIRFGTGAIGTAEALLEMVRHRNPDAFVVYKPHPDVLSGNRKGLVHAHRLADVVDAEADVLSLIDRADEVHVLSSLAGFDALLRGKRVFTYGLPFYAGWGLTEDALPQPWRERELSLDMLVAGALLRYPIYWDWRTRMFTTPEAVVRLLGKSANRPLMRIAGNPARWPAKIWRWTFNAAQFGWWAWQNRESVKRT